MTNNEKAHLKERNNLKIAVLAAIAVTLILYVVLGMYIFIYMFTFGAQFLYPTILLLPWVIKEHPFIYPFFFGIYTFFSVWAILSIFQIFYARRKASTVILSFIVGIIIAALIIISTIIFIEQWYKDIYFIKHRSEYITNSMKSDDPQYLKSLFDYVKESNDSDVYDSSVIQNIAANKNADYVLLNQIYAYANIAPLKYYIKDNQKIEYGRTSILDALASNPNTPPEILKKILEDKTNLNPIEQKAPTADTVLYSYNSLARNPTTPTETLKDIYNKISAYPLDLDANSFQKRPNPANQILSEIIKNPNTSTDLLNEIYTNVSKGKTITYLDLNFTMNPNTPNDIIQSIIERSINRLSDTSANIPVAEFLYIFNISRNISEQTKTEPETITRLFKLPSCDIKTQLFFTLAANKRFPELLNQMAISESDLGLRMEFMIRTNQRILQADNGPVEILNQDESREYQGFMIKISAASTAADLQTIFDSITNPKVQHLLLSTFANNKNLSPDLAAKIFAITQDNIPITAKINAFNGLGMNKNTQPEILKEIIKFALTEVNNGNLIWINALKIVAVNPNFPMEYFQTLMNFPSCGVRNALASNPNIPVQEKEKMKNDADYGVRATVQRFLNPNQP